MQQNLAGSLLILGAVAFSSPSLAAVSKADLLALVEKGVDTSVIVSLVQRDCVDFEMSADELLELSGTVPAEVLKAAVECRNVANNDTTAAPASPLLTPLTLAQVRRVAVMPIPLDSQEDPALTALVMEQLKLQKKRYEFIDPAESGLRLEGQQDAGGEVPLSAALASARELGAEAVLVGTASKYHRFDDRAVQLDLKLIEVNAGKVLWSGGDHGVSQIFSWQGAKKHAAQKAVKKLP